MVLFHVHFFLLLCLVLIPTDGQIDLPFITNDHLALAKTAAHLVRKYYYQQSTTVIVVERSFHSELRDFNKRIMGYILQNLNETIAVQLYSGKSENQPWEYNIFIIDSEQAFLNIAWSLPQNDFDGDFRFLIILTNYTKHYFQTIRNIFWICKGFNVINVNILLDHHTLGVCMYTYKLFSETKCGVVQPYLLFRFLDGFDKLNDVFPNKLLNFHKCSLRICGQQNHPMLTFSGNTSNPRPEKKYWNNLRGIDGQLIRILSRSLNFTIELLPFTQERSYIENHTGFGCYAKLLTNKADIAIGGFSGSDPKRIALTPSVLYYHTPIVFIIRGKRELDCANRLGRPFSIPVWQSIVGLLLSGAFITQTLRMLKHSNRQLIVGERNNAPLLNFFAIFLGYPILRVPKGNLARYLLILWLMMTLILRSAYQGSLYDSIRIDRFEKIPQKYEELFKRNYKFFITKSYRDIDIFNENQTIVINLNHHERLKKLASYKRNYATVALRDHVINYLEENFRKGSDLRIIEEQVYQYQLAMYFQKHSIYASPINQYLNQFNYAGIIRHIARSNAKDRRMFRDSKLGAPLQALTNNRIWSLYQLFMLLMMLTVGTFIFELFSDYFVNLRKILNWFH